ncbi:MAG: SMP-30/gluconolactonase/LRE family protein [Pirellulales bacterium]|nr:SMP-30/gluconolactonase/LRE family protein [Pirellulales bacterium]
MMDAELLLDARAVLGEGALWDASRRRLLWVDIEGREVHIFDPAGGDDVAIDVGQEVGTVVPRARGGLVLGLRRGIALLDPASRELTMLADPESHLPDNRFNDGKCDPAGRFWAGTISHRRQPDAALYRLDPDLSVRRVLEGVVNSNGLAWSLDARAMYYIDTGTHRIDAFGYDRDTGAIRNRRTVVDVPDAMGKPDGMTIDADGMLWVAHWGGGRVNRWDPGTGRLLSTVLVPASRTTSCAFGGPDLATLYITTARTGMTAEALAAEPQAGALFAVRPGVQGLPAFEFAG